MTENQVWHDSETIPIAGFWRPEGGKNQNFGIALKREVRKGTGCPELDYLDDSFVDVVCGAGRPHLP